MPEPAHASALLLPPDTTPSSRWRAFGLRGRRTRGLIAAAIWLLSAAWPAAQDEEDLVWRAAGTKDGVALEFRDDPVLETREVRATVDLPYPARLIFTVVCDYSLYTALVPGIDESRVLEGTVPADYQVYLRYASRFMVVAARDVALRVQEQSAPPERLGCEWSELPDREPPRKGTVRMPLLRGSWTIEPRGDTRARAVYQLAVRPGGRIPGWLVRRGAVSVMPDIVAKVRACLDLEHARSAAVVTCRK